MTMFRNSDFRSNSRSDPPRAYSREHTLFFIIRRHGLQLERPIYLPIFTGDNLLNVSPANLETLHYRPRLAKRP